ncbi:MAG: hypothetical protein ACP5NW_01745 [Candidatus Woesearchaeota archaeon]
MKKSVFVILVLLIVSTTLIVGCSKNTSDQTGQVAARYSAARYSNNSTAASSDSHNINVISISSQSVF